MTIVILSHHARRRLVERKIQENLVRQCLEKPDRKLQPGNGENVNILRINGKALVLVYRQIDEDIFFVITTFVTSKVKRYLN